VPFGTRQVLDLEEADGGETPLRPRQCTWVEAMERAQKTAQATPTPRTPFPWLDSTLAAGAVAPSLGGHGAAVFISMPNQLRLRFLYHGMFGRHGGWLMSPLSTLVAALSWFLLARYTLGINNVAVTLGTIMCDPHGVAAALSSTGSNRSTRRHNVWVRLSLEEACSLSEQSTTNQRWATWLQSLCCSAQWADEPHAARRQCRMALNNSMKLYSCKHDIMVGERRAEVGISIGPPSCKEWERRGARRGLTRVSVRWRRGLWCINCWGRTGRTGAPCGTCGTS